MDYQEFKIAVLEELQRYYQENEKAEICEVLKNNGKSYEGLRITLKTDFRKPVPMIDLSGYYKKYKKGERDIVGCVEEIMEERKHHSCPPWLEQFAGKIVDWEYVKENVYPILLSAKENWKILRNLASMPLLDLSIIYIIRNDVSGECRSSAKITKLMLDYYGVSKEQLHQQALENLKKDGYEFQDMKNMLKSLPFVVEKEKEPEESIEMYILTNASGFYGAAGILDKNLLKQFAGSQDYYILPSSLHEWIFVPAVDIDAKEVLDLMVGEVNAEVVDAEDRLSDHCYYYDAKENEIRMCA